MEEEEIFIGEGKKRPPFGKGRRSMLVEKVKRWSLWMSGESTVHLIQMKTGIRNKGTMRVASSITN
jgi:hypothetical protein